jgi:hypothetical protein
MNTGSTLEILKEEGCSEGPGHRWYDRIKMVLKETVWEIVGQDSDK